MATRITTPPQRLHVASQIVESITEPANNHYYLFYGNHNPAVTTVANVGNTWKETFFDPYYTMSAGKIVKSTDVALSIRNIPYVASVVYDMYDDQDDELATKDFFVVTDEGSFKHVYKCLDNNNGSNSTIEPNFSHISGSNSFIYQTSDGYRWKYMYSVSSAQDLKFSTTSQFPVFANSSVAASATDGTIDIIKVEGQGQGYDNYVTGTLSTSHIEVSGNGYVYEIANITASTTNNFYSGCLMYITNGTGAGQYTQVDSYISNSSGKYVLLQNTFPIIPTNGSQYEIFPRVDCFGTGIDVVNCVARAMVNSLSTNSIYRVEILNRGSGYTYYYSANVYADGAVGVTLPAELRIINPPPGGHGANAALELSCNSVMFSVKISNTEGGLIPATNNFKQIGLVKDPVFANVAIEFGTKNGDFLLGETVHKIRPYRVDANAAINTTSTAVTSAAGDFSNQFTSGEYVFLVSADTLSHQLSMVNVVTNSSHMTIASNGFFSGVTSVYKTTIHANGTFESANTNYIRLGNTQGTISTGDMIVGLSSGGYANVTSTKISEVSKGFDTFIQMYKYKGTVTFGTLAENEIAYQTDGITNTATGLVHSVTFDGANAEVYINEQVGEFDVGGSNTLIGATSGSIIQLTEKYAPELVSRSGHILFVENVESVPRSNTTAETFKVLLTF